MMKSVQASIVVGEVRVQPLGPHLVRIEQRGPSGFEDRETFTVRERGFQAIETKETRESGSVCVATANYRVVVPAGATGLEGIRVESAAGATLCVLSNAMLSKKFLPAPSALPAVWVLGDAPRVVPPARGALPPPKGEDDPTSGWDMANDAPDAYVFFPAASGYEAFRADFLRLTGGIPLVPLYALGLWYSRYHPYSEQTALAVIDRFRKAEIPLDVFVADTDWRVGASCGYGINKELFPDMARFIRLAHERQVRIMLNDHPEPRGKGALDPVELRFRKDGLASLLGLGADLWWFDRNWHTHLQAPAPGLDKEVWGMRLYHDITRDFRPGRRPLIMSNVDGINNGRRDAPSHPAAHRFPVWWTGDTCAEWNYLRMGVSNGVDSGILSLLPYVHEDLGGHHGQPDPELYVRFMQFGAFSPVARIHCTTKVHRYPWEYGAEVERIVGDFFRLRYRLLPMLYAAAFEASRSGTPLLRRCDLEWPAMPEAADSTQYLLGDDLLVAPILEPARGGGCAERTVWIPEGEWQNLWTGRMQRGPATIGVECPLDEFPVFVRLGGVVLSSPLRQSTGTAVWPELTVDAFAPEQDGVRARQLYEDDGISTAHERGECVRTAFALSQAGQETEVHVASGPERRTVTLRVHLPQGSGVREVQCNGQQLFADAYAVLEPLVARVPALFAGPGAPPPAEAGPVVEWRGEIGAEEELDFRVARADS
jgi:alpha-glucosidase